MNESLLPSTTVCDRLGIHRSTLSRWVKDGRITPAYRVPVADGAMFFSPDDVAELEATILGAAAPAKESA
jgi:predicted site-specific integrase-resolvase